MENVEEVLQSLDSFSKLRPKDIPRELEEYLCFVARTGDPVYHWSIIKSLFREKLLHVLTEFHDSTPGLDLPPCPNVDPFNYDTMKNCLLERIESFSSAPFTVQRICELLTSPRKQYSRIDKYMRAIEKNILVVSTREPGNREPETGDPLEAALNGDGFDMHIEIEMDGNLAWKEAAVAAECPVPRNDSAYSTVTDSSNNSTSPDLITNCQNDIDKHSEPLVNLNIDKEESNEHSTKVDPKPYQETNIEQSIIEISASFESEKVLEQEQGEGQLSLEQSLLEPSSVEIESSESVPPQPTLDNFIPTNDTEESTDTSETDSNLTEDSVTSELQESATVVDENTLATSDVESSNDEILFKNVQEVPETNTDIIAAEISDFQQVLRSGDSQISIIQNALEEKEDQHDKIESNMEKLFQIVCESAARSQDEEQTTKSVQDVTEATADSEKILIEPIEITVEKGAEVIELKTEILSSLENPKPLPVSNTEPEQMVDIVENDFLTHLKQNDVTEPLVQDQTESMEIPESAMEVEDTLVVSEPMDQ